MREVIFDYVEDEKGTVVYPAEGMDYFKHTKVVTVDGVKKIHGKYSGKDESLSDYTSTEESTPEIIKKEKTIEERLISIEEKLDLILSK